MGRAAGVTSIAVDASNIIERGRSKVLAYALAGAIALALALIAYQRPCAPDLLQRPPRLSLIKNMPESDKTDRMRRNIAATVMIVGHSALHCAGIHGRTTDPYPDVTDHGPHRFHPDALSSFSDLPWGEGRDCVSDLDDERIMHLDHKSDKRGDWPVRRCSGVIVGRTKNDIPIVATAAHCISTFDFGTRAVVIAGATDLDLIPKGRLGHLQTVLTYIKQDNRDEKDIDIALVTVVGLDTSIQPVEWHDAHPTKGTPIYLLGHPFGLSQSLSRGTALETFSGIGISYSADGGAVISGAPIFDAASDRLVAIHWGYSDTARKCDCQNECECQCGKERCGNTIRCNASLRGTLSSNFVRY